MVRTLTARCISFWFSRLLVVDWNKVWLNYWKILICFQFYPFFLASLLLSHCISLRRILTWDLKCLIFLSVVPLCRIFCLWIFHHRPWIHPQIQTAISSFNIFSSTFYAAHAATTHITHNTLFNIPVIFIFFYFFRGKNDNFFSIFHDICIE